MLRLIVASIFGIHGLIHILGFLREWNVTPIKGLSGPTLVPLSRRAAAAVGLLWLMACVVLSAAAVLLGMERPEWWMVAGAGLGLSQALVVLYWKDAKAGTILNLILLVGCAVLFNGPPN